MCCHMVCGFCLSSCMSCFFWVQLGNHSDKSLHSAIKSLPTTTPSHIHWLCTVSSSLLLAMILGSHWQSLPQPLDCTPSTCPRMSLLDMTLPLGHYPCAQNQHTAKQQNDCPCSLFFLQKNSRGVPSHLPCHPVLGPVQLDLCSRFCTDNVLVNVIIITFGCCLWNKVPETE